MSFSRAKREFFMEKDAKRKSGLPGPQTYDTKSCRVSKISGSFMRPFWDLCHSL